MFEFESAPIKQPSPEVSQPLGLRRTFCAVARLALLLWLLLLAALPCAALPADTPQSDTQVRTTLAYRPERVAMLNASAAKLARSEPGRARAMAEEALLAASAANDQRGRIEALHNLGRVARLLGELSLALERLQQAESLASDYAEPRLLAQVKNSLAITYTLLGLDGEALELHQRVQSLWQELGDQSGEIASIINIGRVFEQRGEIDQARRQFVLAGGRLGEASEPIPDQDRAAIHFGLAQVALRAGEPATALSEIEQALAIQRAAGDRIGEAAALVVRAKALAQSGATERAQQSYDQALALATRLDDRSIMAEVHADLAASAWHSYQQQRGQAGVAAGAARALEEARQHNQQALALARPDSPRRWLPVYRLQAAIHEARGDLAAALAAQKSFIDIRDRWAAEQDQARYALLASRLHLEQREREIARLQAQSSQNTKQIERERTSRYLLLVVIALALLWLLALGLRYRERVRYGEHLRVASERLRQALDDAEHARARAEQADRFKTEMLGMAAHDLRNPLSSIQGFAELVESGRCQTLDESRRFARIIANASRRALALLGDLLESAALDAGRVDLRPIPLDLAPLLVEVIDRVRPRAEAKSQPIEFFGIEHAMVHGDPDRLAQVFENLLSNAIKFSPPQSRIEVRISNTADQIEVAVKDFGQGFGAEEKSRLFQRFQRLSARPTAGESSTGLGLAIVRDLVHLHQGRVEAESPGADRGATFRVILPRFDSNAEVLPWNTGTEG